MELKQRLIRILNRVKEEQKNIPAIKRAIKSASGTFKQTNSKYIEHLIFLATSLQVVGESVLSESLLDFIEEIAIEGKYVHLDGSIAEARLLRIDLYLNKGDVSAADTVKRNHDLSHASNLNNYINPIFEIIEECENNLLSVEQDEDNTHAFILKYSYYMYIEMVVLQGRIEEIQDRINDGDVNYLLAAKNMFQEKFKFYLIEVPTNSELKKYRQSMG